MTQTDQPQPWRCQADGQRLLWGRTLVTCPSCGPVSRNPAPVEATP